MEENKIQIEKFYETLRELLGEDLHQCSVEEVFELLARKWKEISDGTNE